MSVYSDRILYEDRGLLAVNKLSGELVVQGRGKLQKLPLLDFLRKDYPGLQTVHRLDFETSGVVVFAKNADVANAIVASKFKGWKKVYRTLVVGYPRKNGIVRIHLPARHLSKLKAKSSKLIEATTRYHVLKYCRDVSYLEAEIQTGRHHQIRRHFAAIGHPLVLDDVYGDHKANKKFTRKFGYRKFFLHAFSLDLLHPVTGKLIRIEAPLPRVFEKLLAFSF